MISLQISFSIAYANRIKIPVNTFDRKQEFQGIIMIKAQVKLVFRYFFRGLFTLLPLIITWMVVLMLIRIIESQVDIILIFIPKEYRNIPAVFITAEIVTAVGLFLLIALFGLMVKSFFGRHIVKGLDNFLLSIPGIKVVYKASRQFIDLLVADKKKMLMKAVLVEYPAPDRWSVGFITGEMDPACSPDQTQKYYRVFIPTTPNPTSGWLCVVTEDKLRFVPLTVEEAIKLILTGGMVKS